VILVLLAVEGGYRLGRFRRERSDQEKEAPVGTMVGATLGLLALLLAFTFGVAMTRYDARRQALLDEVNAIGTAYLRADLLAEPHRTEVRKLLREYVDIRLEADQSGNFEPAIRRSVEQHNLLWAQAAVIGEKNPGSIVVGLFIRSLNDMIDLHSKRVQAALRSRIPGTIWVALYTVAILALGAMGYHEGLSGTSRSLAILAVAFAFSTALWLVTDLDRPRAGSLRISQQAMIELRNSMTAPKR